MPATPAIPISDCLQNDFVQPLGRFEALPRSMDLCQFAYVHGDLNGANIDGGDNVWIIDFFHTQRGHVLRDLLKLENDLLFIFTPVADEAALQQACRLSDLLLGVEDLGQALPPLDQRGPTAAPRRSCSLPALPLWVLDSARLIEELGFSYRHTSREALTIMLRAKGVLA